MTSLDQDYPGRGMLTKLVICVLIAFLTLNGIFWANSERLKFLNEYDEIINDPDYPNLVLLDQANEKEQMADFYSTLTVLFFVMTLALIGAACYFALKVHYLQAWRAEWDRVSYYLTILGLWAIAVLSIFIALFLIGWFFEL
ncbi:MAG: hypothetical protein ACFFGZ_09060 [Candidatus Thorarchaeota archaeon]